MKTLPTPISTGLSTNLAQFWLVKVEGSAATYYWATQSKNLTAQSLILKDSTVTVTADSGVIAKTIDGEDQVGISQIEYGVDISQGGGISSAADVEIDILNQDRKDTTILATPNRLEYRPVTIYMGYIPAGASPTVEITTDLLQMWTGVVDDVLDFDYGHFRLACTDGVFLRHKDIPTTVIDSTTYLYAPEENLGKPLPLLYGDFYPASVTDLTLALEYEYANPAPLIMTDEPGKIFHLAGHVVSVMSSGSFLLGTSADAVYLFDQATNTFCPIEQTVVQDNLGTIATSTIPSGLTTVNNIYQLKENGTNTSAAITDWQKAGDSDSSNSVSMNVSTRANFYMRTGKIPDRILDTTAAPGTLQINVFVGLGAVSAGFTGTGKFQKDGGALVSSGYTFTSADANIAVLWASALGEPPSEIPKYQFGIIGSGSGTAEIKFIDVFLSRGTIKTTSENRDSDVWEEQILAGPWGRTFTQRVLVSTVYPKRYYG